MDIIRTVAVFSVVSVHFFLNNGFYQNNVAGEKMYLMTLFRTMFMVCVPLFMLLTGYLMSHKKISKRYYFGIVKTLLTYLMAAICCMIYKSITTGNFELKKQILSIFDFSAVQYSWYIEMYIGLFLLIPFLNIIYNNLENQKQKQLLIATLIIITILPSVFNIYNFYSWEWFLRPSSSSDYSKLVPTWWQKIYPLCYYFTGAYIKEYGCKIKTYKLTIIFVISVILFGSFSFYRSYGTNFIWGAYIDWPGFQTYILSVSLFILLSRLNNVKLPLSVKFIFMKISELSLGIYLVSWIFDAYAYPILKTKIPVMTDRMPYYFIIVPFVFLCSTILSFLINLIVKGIICIFKFNNKLYVLK